MFRFLQLPKGPNILIHSLMNLYTSTVELIYGARFSRNLNEFFLQVIAATNRVDILDPALLRSGRLDRKIEFPAPTEEARARIMQIHSRKMTISKDVNFDELARSTDDFNGAQCKAVCVEAGMIALRREATLVTHEDFMDAILEVQAKKKQNLNYYA